MRSRLPDKSRTHLMHMMFTSKKTKKKDSNELETIHSEKRFEIDTEDIIAIFAGFIAIIFTLGMYFGRMPINEYTIGVVGFAGAGGAIAKIIQARSKKKDKSNG